MLCLKETHRHFCPSRGRASPSLAPAPRESGGQSCWGPRQRGGSTEQAAHTCWAKKRNSHAEAHFLVSHHLRRKTASKCETIFTLKGQRQPRNRAEEKVLAEGTGGLLTAARGWHRQAGHAQRRGGPPEPGGGGWGAPSSCRTRPMSRRQDGCHGKKCRSGDICPRRPVGVRSQGGLPRGGGPSALNF